MTESSIRDSYIPLDDMIGHESERTLTPTNEDKPVPSRRNMDEEATVEGSGKETGPTDVTLEDPNAVGWDGPDDPNNPMNWPARKKWLNIGALSIMTLLT